jgi:MoaA/NifB/PqqE/SkfB family radical SAM enzyme
VSQHRLPIHDERALADSREIGYPIRLIDRCNQRCHFCNVDESAPGHAPDLEAVRRRARAAVKAGMRMVVFSGGEPTLSDHLADAIAVSKAEGAELVMLQTNAVLLDHAERAQALARAGLGLAFVSLHAADPEISDRITRAPGTHARTLRGIDNLVAAGVQVMINCVVCDLNYGDVVKLVDLVADRWRSAVWFNFSFVSPEIKIESDLDVLPRLSTVLPYVKRALRRAEERGLKFTCADRCGFPPCLLVDFADHVDFFVERPAPRELTSDRVQGPACTKCAVRASCLGVWTEYARRHGTEELRALKAWPKLKDTRSMLDRFLDTRS